MAQNAGPEDAERREHPEEDRESIWSIPAKYKGWYFGLFSLQVVIAAIWLIRTAIVDDSLNSVPGVLLFIWQGIAPMAISSAAFALVIIDTWKTTMVFGTWLEETLEKRKQRQIMAAANKARTQERQQWVDWNRRREAAAAAGEEFNEPPPGTDQETEDNQQN